MKKDGRQTCIELAEKMNCNAAMVFRHHKPIGFAQKLSAMVHKGLSKPTEENACKLLLNNSADTE